MFKGITEKENTSAHFEKHKQTTKNKKQQKTRLSPGG